MKRFLLRVTAFLAIQICFFAYIYHKGNPAISHSSYYHAMYDKMEYLNSLQGRRLIIAGGSSVAFGTDSNRVAREMEWKPVNIGLHAAIGFKFYLQLIQENVRTGDLVLLLPEYEMLFGHENAKVKHEMMQACPQFATQLWSDWKSRKKLLDRYSLQLMHDWMVRAFRSPPPVTQGVYSRQGFNAQGDMIAHHGLEDEKGLKTHFRPLAPEHIQQAEEMVVELNRFARFCKRKGVQVVISYPPISRSRFDRSRDILTKLHGLLISQLEIDIINRPDDFIYASDQFYDSYYHLKETGKRMRSDRLNLALQDYLAVPQQVADRNLDFIR